MLKKFMRRSRKLLVKTKDTLKVVIAAILIATQTLPLPVYAAGQGYLAPLTNLKNNFYSYCSGGRSNCTRIWRS